MSIQMTVTALPDFPLVEPGDDLSALLEQSMASAGMQFEHGDVIVLAQKIISKAEDRYRLLNDVDVDEEAHNLAQLVDKDPRLVALILSESEEVLRTRPGVIIVQHRNGYVHANAGIDRSNIFSDPDNPRVLLLPEDADASARDIREGIRLRFGCDVAVIINDSAGRAWRNGTIGMAIGSAGLQPIENVVGQQDLFDRAMEVTEVAVADELAAAASHLMGQVAEGCPAVLIRGARWAPAEQGSSALIRDKALDLFR